MTKPCDIRLIVLAVCACVFLAACPGPRQNGFVTMYVPKTQIVPAQKKVALEVENGKQGLALAKEAADRINTASTVAVSPFVNSVDPGRDAPLNKLLAVQVAAPFTDMGFRVGGSANRPPAPSSADLPANDEDSDALPRTATRLQGTYTVGLDHIYVAAAVINQSSGAMVAAANWALPMNTETRALVGADVCGRSTQPTVDTKLGGQPSASVSEVPEWPPIDGWPGAAN